MKRNDYMRKYWSGYRAAAADDHDSGINEVKFNLDYGLNGNTRAYCEGYRRYYVRRMERAGKWAR